MNRIINDIVKKRNGHYCHALEPTDQYDLECIVDTLIEEFLGEGYNPKEIREFFTSMEIYMQDDSDINIHTVIDEALENLDFYPDFETFVSDLNYQLGFYGFSGHNLTDEEIKKVHDNRLTIDSTFDIVVDKFSGFKFKDSYDHRKKVYTC